MFSIKTKLKKNFKTIFDSKSGFTLIEIVVVLGLTAISVGLTADILVSISRSYNRTQIFNELEHQSSFLSSKLNKELRDASSVIFPNTLGSSSNEITFINKTDGKNIKYYLLDNVIFRQIGSSNAIPVTSKTGVEGVFVNCNPNCFSVSSINPFVINYNFSFSKSSELNVASTIKINDTVVLRSTY